LAQENLFIMKFQAFPLLSVERAKGKASES